LTKEGATAMNLVDKTANIDEEGISKVIISNEKVNFI